VSDKDQHFSRYKVKMNFFRSTPKTQSESKDRLDELTALIEEGKYDAFRSRMVALAGELEESPVLFSTLLVEVVYYLEQDNQHELRSQFYSLLIKYTAPQKLADSLKRRSDELWQCVLREVASSGNEVTVVPYSSTEGFRDVKQGGGLKWKTETFRHNYCLIMAYALIVRVALAVTELEGCDLKTWRVKIDKTITAIFSQSRVENPLTYEAFKAFLSQQPWWTQVENSLDGVIGTVWWEKHPIPRGGV
jgi:hypothetical protein